MEANYDISVVTIFYFLAAMAMLLVVKFHFPQGFFLHQLSRLFKIHRLFF
ncbi:hypothetical protein IMPR6_50237 [Imperialibacter sp. EC-SDR9]|jgi:hypothetical protein|nr:hypothetical protein IMPR6_50237 [Imperialibacter sp. EC-SDR9]